MNYHKLSGLNQCPFIIFHSVSQKSGRMWVSSPLQVPQGWNQNVGCIKFSSGGSGEVPASKLMLVVERIHFLVAVPRSLLSGWLWAWSSSQVCSLFLSMWPFSSSKSTIDNPLCFVFLSNVYSLRVHLLPPNAENVLLWKGLWGSDRSMPMSSLS